MMILNHLQCGLYCCSGIYYALNLYNNSQRVENNKELVNFDLKAKFFILSKLMFADIKESPFIFIICIGILTLYWLLLTYDWFFYVLLAIALIVFIFCKIRRKR